MKLLNIVLLMNEKIKKALVYLLNEEIVVTSWGITNININDTSVRFEVSGFLYKGKVELTPCESGYIIKLDNAENIHCQLEELVRTLDTRIERGESYESQLQEWLSSK